MGEGTEAVDVLVWGGGSGGVAAALQAARSGARTLLLTPGPWLGGMVSAAGVCCPDGNELSPWQTGLWGALLRALAVATPGGLDQNWVSCFGYRPADAEAILRRWVAAEARLRWWPGARLRDLQCRDGRIVAATVQRSGPGPEPVPAGPVERLEPAIVIDGSDRGDLLPLAGAAFRFGWEAQETWGEPSAPPQQALQSDPFFARQNVQSPTWVVLGQLGQGRGPGGLRPPLAEPFGGACERFGLEATLTYGRLPGGLVMLNWPLAGNDWHQGLERAFPPEGAAADEEVEASLAVAMQEHSRAFAAALEEASGGWLQRGRAFPSPAEAKAGALEGGADLALMPYWREGRRLVAEALVLEQHLLPGGPGAQIAPLPLENAATTAIAVGNYANDHHYPGPDWPLAPKSCRWGGRWSGTPFTIPWGALRSRDVANLLAADKCFGVSHMANGATRLQPLVLNIGQAAGLAAALCVRGGVLPAELPVRQLQEALINEPTAPAGPLPLWDTPWHDPRWRERQLQVLADPSRLDGAGRLAGADSDPRRAPAEVGERLWRGRVRGDGEGGFRLEGYPGPDGHFWRLITLEPALHDWLQAGPPSGEVGLIGCANPWGPWLRVSRLAE
ncbi:MAG: FAD-dependent oxidoreductase [Synechococcaceae cyanobacterium]|nr:FAD-dependent oxidoreductase [Synechococcaceae cyanobacterium]